MSSSSDLSCCIYCGRDTKAKDGICSRCRGGKGPYGKSHEEEIGRKARTITEGKSSIEPCYDDAYHGDTVRDDL